MKTILFLLIVAITVLSCVKENTSTIPLNNTVDTTITGMSRYNGIFINGPYGTVTGNARIYDQNGKLLLALEGVSISNGPDLHVYLSQEVLPVNFIDLGRLQSIAGNQVYVIPGAPDFTQYKYALIHCQRYNHLFGSAELQ